jgi:hypothetical protein
LLRAHPLLGDGDGLHRDRRLRPVAGVAIDPADRVDHILAVRDLAERGVLAVEPGRASAVTMKNWLPFVFAAFSLAASR